MGEPKEGKIFLEKFPTPCLVLPTNLGQLLYSPVDLKTHIDEPVLGLLDVFDLVHRDFEDMSLKELCTQPSNVTYLMGYRGTNGNLANVDNTGVFIDAKAGRKHCSVTQYVSRMRIDQPSAIVALADEVSVTDSAKRVRRGHERSSGWLQATLHATRENKSSVNGRDIGVLAVHLPTIPGDRRENGAAVSSVYADPAIQGIVLGGVYTTPLPTSDRLAYIQAARANLPAHLPLLTLYSAKGERAGIYNPLQDSSKTVASGGNEALPEEKLAKFKKTPQNAQKQGKSAQQNEVKAVPQTFLDILLDVSSGVDVVYTTLPLLYTLRGQAFCLSPQEDWVGSSESTSNTSDTGNNVGSVGKRRREDEVLDRGKRKKEDGADSAYTVILPSIPTATTVASHLPPVATSTPSRTGREVFTMSLWDAVYREDTRPLVEGCGCACCLHHTRSYLHHLLLASELLAEILLYQHNQFALLRAFEKMRQVGSQGLQKWVQDRVAEWE